MVAKDGRRMDRDKRVCYGSNCTWWGSIHDVGVRPAIIDGKRRMMPCCPVCMNMLMEVDSERVWWQNVENYINEQNKDPEYRRFVMWLRNKCFPNMEVAWQAWEVLDKQELRFSRR